MRDREFLFWVADTIACVHGESELVDFVLKLRAIARVTNPWQDTGLFTAQHALDNRAFLKAKKE